MLKNRLFHQRNVRNMTRPFFSFGKSHIYICVFTFHWNWNLICRRCEDFKTLQGQCVPNKYGSETLSIRLSEPSGNMYFGTVPYYTILYYTILYYTILYYTILYYTIPYYTILYYTILYYTILYYSFLIFLMLS